MRRTALLEKSPICTAPERYSSQVLAVSQIVELGEKQFLNIDLFYMGFLKGRYFACEEEKKHAAYIDGKWHSCMINNVARICKDMEPLKGNYYYYGKDWEYATKEDKERVRNYLDAYDITSFENQENEIKYQKAYKRKAERIDRIMDKVPCVPDDTENWVKRVVFPEDFLFISKMKNRTVYHCTACGYRSWRKKSWKHGEKTTCPKCGAQVTAYSRKTEKIEKAPIILLQAYGEEWVERQFKVVCRWAAGVKEIELYEEIRAVIPKGDCWGTVYYGVLSEADEFQQEFWDKNQVNKRFMSSYLYPGNLKEVLPYGDLQNSGLDLLAKNRVKLNVNKFITTFHTWPWLEYLIKAGFTKLVAEIVEKYAWWGAPGCIDTYAENLKSALKLDGNRTSRMKQLNGGVNTLKWLQYEKEREDAGQKIRISKETLEYLNTKNVSKSECQEILNELGSVNRMVNYMKKQRISPKNLTQTWRDYLNMARSEGLDTSDDIVRLPKDLKARHDHLVEIINARRDEERIRENEKKYKILDAQIKNHLPETKRYFWENESYMIIPAGKCMELAEEGCTLHHCVASSDRYMRSMADGKTWILFLRKKNNLGQPYYTIEIDMKDDQILQYYSEFDRKPGKEIVDKVLSEFKKESKTAADTNSDSSITGDNL